MTREDIAFEEHCREDLYFFCPLCKEYHEKTLTTKGEYKSIWWCQAPLEADQMKALLKTIEFDDIKFDKWCFKHKVGKRVGKYYIVDEIHKLAEEYLKRENLK